MFRGDETAARELVQRLERPLYGTLLRLTRNPADAEELFQETFVRALGASGSYDRQRRFRPWIFAIAVNLARDRAKRAAHRATPRAKPAEELPERTDREDVESRWIAHADLFGALESLPDLHREIVEMRYLEGLDEPEIARAAGIPRGTVKSRLHHAMRKLREALRGGWTA